MSKSRERFNVIAKSWGGTKCPVLVGLTEKEAVEFCEENNWQLCPDGGYVWDLVIEEEW